jgi:hypothetical protein
LTISAVELTVRKALSEKSTSCASANEQQKDKEIMGDKSPKAVHKQAAQKQIKANAANQKKQQALTAKQAPIKMK